MLFRGFWRFQSTFLNFFHFFGILSLMLCGEEAKNKATFVRKSVLFMFEVMKKFSLQWASGPLIAAS